MKRYTIVMEKVDDDTASHIYSVLTGIKLATSRLDFSYRNYGVLGSNIDIITNSPRLVSALRSELSNFGVEIIDP